MELRPYSNQPTQSLETNGPTDKFVSCSFLGSLFEATIGWRPQRFGTGLLRGRVEITELGLQGELFLVERICPIVDGESFA